MTVTCILIDISIAIITFLLGLGFYRSEGRAVRFLTGYNMRPENERKSPDVETKMCRNYGKRMMLMAVPFIFGACIDFFYVGIGSVIAWAIWVIMMVMLIIRRNQLEN